MIKLTTKNTKKFSLSLITKKEVGSRDIILKEKVITEIADEKQAFIYIEKDLTIESLKGLAKVIASTPREYQIDIESFTNTKVKESDVIWALFEADLEAFPAIYSAKTKKADKKVNELINISGDGKKVAKKASILIEAKRLTMDLQIMPPNILNSETYAKKLKEIFVNDKNISVKVLGKKEITALKMGLLLSVNKGSAYDPKVVVLEYVGNTKSKDKTVFVGKGVTFDSGGYNIKTGRFMAGMKFDMSGSASVAGAMKAIAQLKPKSNASAVLVLTDNMVNSVASTPDAIWYAMNGKSVEINNTDAEGRLAMADGMVYAAKKLNATRIITIATLTGAVIAALGSTYSGTWATTDKAWDDISKASIIANENLWRMPLHKDYFKFMSKSKVADMFNTDLSGKGGSSSAAMFLTQFREDVEYIHLDIAGTADIDAVPQGAVVKTLFEVVNG